MNLSLALDESLFLPPDTCCFCGQALAYPPLVMSFATKLASVCRRVGRRGQKTYLWTLKRSEDDSERCVLPYPRDDFPLRHADTLLPGQPVLLALRQVAEQLHVETGFQQNFPMGRVPIQLVGLLMVSGWRRVRGRRSHHVVHKWHGHSAHWPLGIFCSTAAFTEEWTVEITPACDSVFAYG